ncbi:Ig domain-containing protein [Acetobacterium malicum]|uniref:Ig domain-containing protein n=1 Tax=Acetobacterium malicum TaxID=52692 RepID=UPI000429A935|nr:Ig domain-containing protein [Acetobacterium dehalogenans]
MKNKFQFVFRLFLAFMLLLTTIPIGVIAETQEYADVQIPIVAEDNVQLSEESVSVHTDTMTTPSCFYRTHVQNEGWQEWKSNGGMSGTSGKGLRLEGIEIKLDQQGCDLGVSYSTHVQNIGWQGSKIDGVTSGTSGQGLRLEAIRINLTGSDAELFDIYYQVHVQNYGWLDWAKNGAEAGTQGLGLHLEGINILIFPKGSVAPGATMTPYVSVDAFLNNIKGDWYNRSLKFAGPHLKIREPNVESGLLWLGMKWHEYRYRIVSISRDGKSGTIEAYKWNYYKPYATSSGSTAFQKVEMDVNPPDQYVDNSNTNTLTESEQTGSSVRVINYTRN